MVISWTVEEFDCVLYGFTGRAAAVLGSTLTLGDVMNDGVLMVGDSPSLSHGVGRLTSGILLWK